MQVEKTQPKESSMIVDTIQGMLEDAREELNRVQDIKQDVEQRIEELNELNDRAGDIEARAMETIDALEELSFVLGEVEVIADDANNLGVY